LDDNETVKLDQVRLVRSATRYPTLIVLQGDHLGASVSLDKKTVTIGRGSDCDVRLDDNLASRQHAQLVRSASGASYALLDLGSTNGTFVNGQLVDDSYALDDGDKIRVGRHVFKFAWLDEYETEFQERLQQMIARDDLTNLLTQRSFFVEFERQINWRNAQPDERGALAVLMMDLDHFKQVNDTYGHLVGSQTIKQIGEIIETTLGPAAVPARYGGEEYIAFMPDASPEEALGVAERLRDAIAAHEIVVTRKGAEVRLRVTISIGIANYPTDGDVPVDLIERADLALYRAKTDGRNRCCVFDVALDTFEGEGYQRLDLTSMLQDSDAVG
jgi:diguanylate cyclase (GGDEF)-like protein